MIMMEPKSNKNLYRWERFSSDRVVKRTTKPEPATDDIEAWIKKVEEASETAAAATFGKRRNRTGTTAAILSTVEQLHDHDAAHDEAQELLSDWLNNKLNVADNNEIEAVIWKDEDGSIDDENRSTDLMPSIKHIIQESDAQEISMDEYERLMNIDNYNEEEMVESVIEQMRNKEIVKPDFFGDLGEICGMPTKTLARDPTLKMEMRHKKVKESREKKRQEYLKKQEQDRVRREALIQAKHKAAEERRLLTEKSKREEAEIQQEMARIRKELAEERKVQLRRQEEERELEARLNKVMREKPKIVPPEDDRTISNQLQVDLERKRKIVAAMEAAEKKSAAVNYSLLRRCFAMWLDIVLERRMQLGKARAVADWKRLFRAWNAWRSYCRELNLEREREKHETSIKEAHRKMHHATEHHRRVLLRRYFTLWQLWIIREQERKELERNTSTRKEKMSAFLEAAKDLADQSVVSPAAGDTHRSSVITHQIDHLLDEGNRRKRQHSAPSRNTVMQDAWQVTRKHMLRAKNESPLVNGHTEIDEKPGTALSTGRQSERVPKGFENRFAAQQRILQEQQKALKEQQRMIEELKFQQDRKLLEQQVRQQEVIQQQLENLTRLALHERAIGGMKIAPDAALSADGNINKESPSGRLQENTARSQVSAAASDTSVATASTFANKMAERAKERARLKQEREEKRRQMEEQKIAELLAQEELTRQQEVEEKRKRIETHREKKRLEQLRELELQQKKEQTLVKQKRADEHSRLRILKHYGFNQLVKLYRLSIEQEKVAIEKAQAGLLRLAFKHWQTRASQAECNRNVKADTLSRLHRLRRCFRNWTKWRHQNQILETKADKFFKAQLVSKFFRAWLDLTTREKIEMWEKERIARQHDILRLKRFVMETWKQLPVQIQKERERERRREELRKRVTSILPDFSAS